MIMNRFLKFSIATLFVGTLACNAIAAPAPKSGEGTALVDEAENAKAKAAPAKKKDDVQKDASAEQAAPKKKKPACEPAPAEDSGSFPVVPVTFASISTIAFIILAIIF